MSLMKLLTAAAAVSIVALSAAAVTPKPRPVSASAPGSTLKPRSTLAPFNNGKPANGAAWFGATLGDGKTKGTGWPSRTDMQSMIDLGVKAIRLPFQPRYCLNPDGTLNPWVLNTLAQTIKYNMARNVSTALDAHTYKSFNDPAVARFWALFAPAIEKAIGGPTPLLGIELSNEPGRSSKDLSLWTEPLRQTIWQIRAAGYQGYILAGAGDWNNMVFLEKALTEVKQTGGATAMDPFNRTIYTGHDYWNKDSNPAKTRNDQGAAVDGTINIVRRYGPTIAIARKLGVKLVMSEIGGGISPQGALPPLNGVGKDGKQLQSEYISYAKANEDVLIGSWFWAGGKISKTYRHRVAPGNEHTTSLQSLWGRAR
jgi:hypothetical protein